MRIQHNITAMNSYRNYSANTKAVSKNLEKLSSGYRINRAGDDAAGLAISEKMRAQITGLKTAQKNAKDGISLIQTAEGALTEVHSMLNRMVELADQSANGTFDDTTDRANLQKEISQLKSEIDRIADSTNFNGIKLLDGSLASKMEDASDLADSAIIKGSQKLVGLATATVGAAAGAYEVKIALDSAGGAGTTTWAASKTSKQLDITLTDSNGKKHTLKFAFAAASGADITAAGVASAVDAVLKNGIGSMASTTQFYRENKETIEALKEVFSNVKISKGATASTAGELTITATSKNTGSAGIGLKNIAIKEHAVSASGVVGATATFSTNLSLAGDINANVTTAATDAYTHLTAAGGFGAGNKFSIGDHTFELKAGDDYDVADGNVRVVVGADDTETKKNLVAAMQKAGITSASLTSDGKIRIDKLEQLNTSDKKVSYNNMVDIKSDSLGVDIGNVDETNAKTSFAAVAGAVGTKSTLGIGYTDADGNAKVLKVEYTAAATASVNAQAMLDAINNSNDAKGLFKASKDASGNVVIESLGGMKGSAIKTITTTDTTNAIGTLTQTAPAAAGKSVEIKAGLANGDTVSIGGKEYQFLSSTDIADPSKIKKGATAILIGTTSSATTKNLQAALANDGIKATKDPSNASKLIIYDGEKLETGKVSGGLTLQIGDTSDDFNKLTVSVGDMHAKSLGIGDIDISTQEGASAAIDKLKAAINSVSSTRGDLGAAQNRLDHTINNLSVMHENIQDAESSIRDVDVADEMMAYTKNNILVQSAQAMLAQANQLPQGVLQLLG